MAQLILVGAKAHLSPVGFFSHLTRQDARASFLGTWTARGLPMRAELSWTGLNWAGLEDRGPNFLNGAAQMSSGSARRRGGGRSSPSPSKLRARPAELFTSARKDPVPPARSTKPGADGLCFGLGGWRPGREAQVTRQGLLVISGPPNPAAPRRRLSKGQGK